MKNIHYGDVLIKFPAVLDCQKEEIPYVNRDCISKLGTVVLHDKDVIIADTAEDETVGKATELINVGEQRIVSGLHTIPCRPKQPEQFAPKWLGYFINHRSYHNQLLPLITGTKVSSVSKSAIADTVIVIPERNEQERIVNALSDIDELILDLEKLISKKKDIRNGAMQQLLTGKQRLSGFDDEWDIVVLGKYCSVVRGGSPRPIQDFLTTGEGINWIKIGDVSPDAKYITSTQERIIEDGVSMSRMVYKGDLILSNSMSFGRPYILKLDGCIHDGWLAIQNYQATFDRDYLFYVLSSEYVFLQYIQLAAGSSVQNLNKEKVESLEVYRPKNRNEQEAIASILSDMDVEIDLLYIKLEKYKELKAGMMDELLTGNIRI